VCTLVGSAASTLAVLWTQQRWVRVAGNTSRSAAHSPRAPSPTASTGAGMPRRRRSRSSSAHDWVDPAQPVGDRDQLLGPVAADPDDDQGAQPLLGEPDVDVHPVGPHLEVVPIGQAVGHERLPLGLPRHRQPGDHRRRQPGRGPQEALQRRDEVP